MVHVSDAKFIVIDDEVAMSGETACEILGVTPEKLRELSRQAKSSKGIHVRGGQIYFSTVDAIFSVRNANGKKSADLSTVELTRMFETAEDRLLPREIVKAKRKRTYIKMGVFGLIVAGFFVYSVNSEPTPKPAPLPPPKIETPVEKPVEVPVPAPAKVVNLGMTLEQFKAAYKSNALAASGRDFNIDNAELMTGEVQNVFKCAISPNVVVMGSIDKASGRVKESWVLLTPKEASDMLDALIAYGLIISVASPELTADQRGELMLELKLEPERIKELQTSDGRAVRGNVKYHTSFAPKVGFMFAASAKDL